MDWKRWVALALIALFVTYAMWAFFAPPHGRARTKPDADDPSLRTRCFDATIEEVIDRAAFFITRAERWTLTATDRGNGTIRAVHETEKLGFKDDVILIASPVVGEDHTPAPANRTQVDASSASRFGKRDFGQNAANIRELLGDLDANLPGCKEIVAG